MQILDLFLLETKGENVQGSIEVQMYYTSFKSDSCSH